MSNQPRFRELIEDDTVDVWTMLRRLFRVGEYALLPEVRNAAGFGATRSADYIALGLWPSRGLEIHGIEVKRCRNDWLRELKNPAKAEAVFKFCDRWWIVATNDSICKKEELPKTWGLLVITKRGLSVVVDAPKLDPKPMTRDFLASMMKRATDAMVSRDSIKAELERARKDGQDTAKRTIARLEADVKRLEDAIYKFEKASGVRIIGTYNAGEIGAAVRMVMNGGTDQIKEELRHLEQRAAEVHAQVHKALEGLK